MDHRLFACPVQIPIKGKDDEQTRFLTSQCNASFLCFCPAGTLTNLLGSSNGAAACRRSPHNGVFGDPIIYNIIVMYSLFIT
jgi:hypothetical protein